jgi:F-type H+-transporting ATPase subunit b
VEQFSWWQSVIFPYINFGIFIVALIYFARGPLRKMAKQRQEDYAALLGKSLEMQREADKQLAELKQRMAGLNRELSELRQRLHSEAEKESEKILEKGQAIKTYILEEAERIRAAEVAKAEEELHAQIIELVKKNIAQEIKSTWQEAEQSAFTRHQTAELKQIVS